MAAPKIKLWRREVEAFVSPRFHSRGDFDRAKKFFIRAGIITDCDEVNLIMRITIIGKKGEENVRRLDKLGILP